MQFSVVYCLSGQNRRYADLAHLSAKSLRYWSPKIPIFLATDNDTCQHLKNTNHPLLSLCQTFCFDVPQELEHKARSRFIKTSFGLSITGNLIFVDCDTIFLRPIESLVEIWDKKSIAAVSNYDSLSALASRIFYNLLYRRRLSIFPSSKAKLYSTMNWKSGRQYFNTGLLCIPDHLRHQFFTLWHKEWIKCFHKCKSVLDQPVFNHIIHSNPKLKVNSIPWKWNTCIGVADPFKIKEPALLHYYEGGDDHKPNEIKLLIQKQFSLDESKLGNSLTQLKDPHNLYSSHLARYIKATSCIIYDTLKSIRRCGS